ncbi:hypothetical protein FD15_GL001186 [Liquorilactobacillus sucicola DSM 21376 = JCM 15457]|uniref:Uncharacterized protein n=1 Tax=Liquorilactobacillus sucicola DSM 21376 = JCM 15457 TaxID=1423806 RepID=A0A0R2DPI4_9LACO|nr:hypothetical protein [Liquorilactobacillus sucicola]KRN06000.1 hypothetical protein FD15_GL001186 [Liquorilactobacillus sucicola DSM 21376 = JCM 15457]
MRKLYVRKGRLAEQGASTISDKNRKKLYLIVGKWGRHQDVLSVYAISGALLAEIKQHGFGLLPHFDLFKDNKRVGSLRRYHFGRKDILIVRGLNWFIVGDLYTSHYRIFHGRRTIMTLQEVTLPFENGDYLELTIDNEEDEALCVCIVAILDHLLRSISKKHAHLYNLRVKYD